ncbi:MAG: polyphosphate kinase 2 family protein [Candidatus Methylumidiphilus sp.]
MIKKKVIDQIRVTPGKKVNLKDFGTSWASLPELKDFGKEEVKQKAAELLEENREELSKAQELLWASDIHSVLVVLQAMDAAGKDGIIKHVMSGLNPQGCEVQSFKQPTAEELDHNFLWRYMCRTPERGRIGIFNRSYYEDVLVVKVHPEMLDKAKLPPGKRGDGFWEKRYEDINAFEHHLVRNGTLVLKFFLHISKDEQKKRFLERLENPDKHWKFSAADMAERGFWNEYAKAFEDALSATSTKWAPWYVIPADHKWVARTLISDILVTSIKSLDLEFPTVSEEKNAALVEAKRQLDQEES